MLPSLANLGCDTGLPLQSEGGQPKPKRARKERRTPILVNGEWVHHYQYAPLDNVSIRDAVEQLWLDAAVTAKYGPIAEWDVSEVEDFSRLFKGRLVGDLYGWDVGNATDMRFMFQAATSFNSDLSEWNVENVKKVQAMFDRATSFNSDLSKWNVRNVTSMASMFRGARRFTSDLSEWNVGNVEAMGEIFLDATSFDSDLSKWDVGNVRYMHRMFSGATSFASDLSQWNMTKVRNTDDMFKGATSFGPPLKQGGDRGWTPESLAEHVAFVESSDVLKTYRARRRWREVRELWYVARSVVRALLIWTEERLVDERRYDAENPAMRKQLEDELEWFREDLGRSGEFTARARRLCEILLHTNHSPPTQTRLV